MTNYQKELKEDKDKIISQKNVLSQEELQKKSISLEEKAKKYNKIISTKNNKLSEDQIKCLEKLGFVWALKNKEN